MTKCGGLPPAASALFQSSAQGVLSRRHGRAATDEQRLDGGDRLRYDDASASWLEAPRAIQQIAPGTELLIDAPINS